MPQGGEHIAYGLGAVADEDPALTFRSEVCLALSKYAPGVPVDESTAITAAVEVFRVWLERHNTELRQARAEAERYRARVDGANLVLWQALRGISDDKPEQAMRLALAVLDGLNEQQAGEGQS